MVRLTQASFAGAAIAASLWLAAPAAAEAVSPQAVGCKLIRNAAQLQAIRNDLAGSYCLANDIDASSIANFVPIGDDVTPFTGKLFGNGRVIRNLKIDGGLRAGLFGTAVYGAVIQSVRLENVDIVTAVADASVGGLVGYILGNAGTSTEIRRVHVSGRVAGPNSGYAGGIAGVADSVTLADSWSSAAVSGAFTAGGAIGRANKATIHRVYATGPVTCTAASCYYVGGLIGLGFEATVVLSYASGRVIAGAVGGSAGGLVGTAEDSTIRRSHALGAVTAGADQAYAGGLIGYLTNGTLTEVYASGRVTGGSGAMLGGLVAAGSGALNVTSGYWDTVTSKQTVSIGGAGYTTAQLRNVLLPGFGSDWAITAKRSYPFLNEPDIGFAAPLATLVKTGRVYTVLPIGQHDRSQYTTTAVTPAVYSLAAVYTMIARAIGVTRDIAALKNVKIDRFWNDTRKIAAWRGSASTRATLGTFKTIAANARLNNANVIGEMKIGRLAILRGTYTKANGGKAEHWLLGTLYTATGNALDAVVANDPWTGMQVTIDPITKKVVWPANYPLTGFKVDGYQPMTLN